MIPIMMLRAGLLAAFATVQGLSVVSAGDQTHVLIEAEGGEVTYEHQMLTNPPRIVVDVAGADFDLPQTRFLDINRGGVLALRTSQFQPGVVRVVVDLAQTVDYEIDQASGRVRISFPNPGGPFERWSSGPSTAAPARAAPVEREPMGQPVQEQRSVDRPTTTVPVSTPPVVEAQEPEQPPITVEFRNTPINDVLGTFADFSGRSIVPGQGVTNQTITAAIQGQPWDEAMAAILEGQGLTATELASGIIMVTSLQQQRQLETQEEVVTEAFQLQYVSVDSVAPRIRQLLGTGEQTVGYVEPFAATNSIMISARQSVVDKVRDMMVRLDQPTPQVTVQVRILSVRRSDFEGLGIHYELKDSHGTMMNRLTDGWVDTNGDQVFQPDEQVTPQQEPEQVNLSGATVAAVGNAMERIPNATFEVISTLLIGRHTLVTWIDAVERLQMAELQADPVVTVMDHRTARVHVGERTPIRVVDQGAASAQGPQAQVRTEETGVILELTPHVVGTNQVRIVMHAERSEILAASADEGYVFGTSETDTEILLDNGETAVISGLTTRDLLNTRQGIPLLMNLPLIGGLFGNTYVEETKEDLLIMVTPYIDRSGGF